MLSIINSVSKNEIRKDWKVNVEDTLKKSVKSPYDQYVQEFMKFLEDLDEKWWSSDESTRNKFAYHMALLKADSNKTNVVRAKINSYYAYLVYKGYVSAYKLMKNKVVAGGESIYTWLRMYREILRR